MKKVLLLFFLCLGMASFAIPGSAQAFMIDWENGPLDVTSIDDPWDAGNARDIDKVWYASDVNFHYFRMDLEQAPSYGGTNAGIYGIYIDAVPNAGSTAHHTYLPAHPGIDFALDSHFDSNMGQFYQHDFHQWDDTNQVMQRMADPDGYSVTENSGRTLEWKISTAWILDHLKVKS